MIQIDGKVRAQVEAEKGISKQEAKRLALAELEKVEEDDIERVVYVEDKLINLVVGA